MSWSSNIDETHTHFTRVSPLRAGVAWCCHVDSEPTNCYRWRERGLQRVGHLERVRAFRAGEGGLISSRAEDVAGEAGPNGRAAHGVAAG